MSNQLVGVVFDRVIQDVCDSSQIDFEEGGVDQQTLEDLRKGWQKKLSSLGVAHFPWDPAPPPPQQQTQIPPPSVTVPSNAPRPATPGTPAQGYRGPVSQPPMMQPVSSQGPLTAPQQASTDVPIKSEGDYPPTTGPPLTAQQRAANALHQRYGAAAANQVHQLQASSQAALSLPGQQRFQPGQYTNPPNQDPRQPQQPQNLAANATLGSAQNDGAGGDSLAEWKAEVARRRQAAQENGGNADRLLRNHVVSRGLQMEGNGLLAPLHERYPGANGKRRKTAGLTATALTSATPDTVAADNTSPKPAGYDGPDDDKEEEDEDAINSDLDDPEENIDDDADDAVGQVMLCTYDKVQHVKGKWKCTLKDGILTTGGKEYVFHKGMGAFEWY